MTSTIYCPIVAKHTHPLNNICMNGNINDLENFLKNNKKFFHSNDITNALAIACDKGKFDILKYLINYNIKLFNNNGNVDVPFIKACLKCNFDIIKYLINLYKNNPYYKKVNIKHSSVKKY